MRDFKYNRHGTIDCMVENPIYGWIPRTMTEKESKNTILTRSDIAPYIEPVKTSDQLRADVDAELKSLDATPRTIAAAITGEKTAIKKITDLEAKKKALRKVRKAIV